MYNKGSWIIHTLRWVMEDEPFFRALRLMAYPDPEKEKVTDGTQVRFSDTDEIRGIAEKVHGKDLRWFFDVYLHQAALPELQVQEAAGKLRLRWKTPGDLPFPMPVPVKVGEEIRRVEMKDGAGSVDLPRGAKWEVDPDHSLLKEEPRRRRGR
jgi:aminopeptidase N